MQTPKNPHNVEKVEKILSVIAKSHDKNPITAALGLEDLSKVNPEGVEVISKLLASGNAVEYFLLKNEVNAKYILEAYAKCLSEDTDLLNNREFKRNFNKFLNFLLSSSKLVNSYSAQINYIVKLAGEDKFKPELKERMDNKKSLTSKKVRFADETLLTELIRNHSNILLKWSSKNINLFEDFSKSKFIDEIMADLTSLAESYSSLDEESIKLLFSRNRLIFLNFNQTPATLVDHFSLMVPRKPFNNIEGIILRSILEKSDMKFLLKCIVNNNSKFLSLRTILRVIDSTSKSGNQQVANDLLGSLKNIINSCSEEELRFIFGIDNKDPKYNPINYMLRFIDGKNIDPVTLELFSRLLLVGVDPNLHLNSNELNVLLKAYTEVLSHPDLLSSSNDRFYSNLDIFLANVKHSRHAKNFVDEIKQVTDLRKSHGNPTLKFENFPKLR